MCGFYFMLESDFNLWASLGFCVVICLFAWRCIPIPMVKILMFVKIVGYIYGFGLGAFEKGVQVCFPLAEAIKFCIKM